MSDGNAFENKKKNDYKLSKNTRTKKRFMIMADFATQATIWNDKS